MGSDVALWLLLLCFLYPYLLVQVHSTERVVSVISQTAPSQQEAAANAIAIMCAVPLDRVAVVECMSVILFIARLMSFILTFEWAVIM